MLAIDLTFSICSSQITGNCRYVEASYLGSLFTLTPPLSTPMIRISYMTLHILILLAACTAIASGSTEGKEAPKIPGITRVEPGRKIQDIKSDPFTMSEATIDGGILTIKVSYSGGHKNHDFAVYWDGSTKKSSPPQADIYLKHDAHDDMAEALIMKTLEFDLAEMSKPMVITVHTDHGDKGKVTYSKP